MRSKDRVDDDSQTQDNNYFLDYMSKKTSTCFSDSLLSGLQLDDLYNHFEVSLTGFEVRPCVHALQLIFIQHPHGPVRNICLFAGEGVDG